MKLAELMARYEERASVARAQQSTAPVAAVYRLVLDELADVDGFESAGRWMASGEASDVLGVSPKTVRKWCNEARSPGAEKTSDTRGVWRIPAEEVYRSGRRAARTDRIPRLWRPDDEQT